MAIGKSCAQKLVRREIADRGRLQTEWTLVFDLDVFDRMQPMPEREAAGDDESDQDADEKEQPIRGQGDEEDGDDGNGGDQSGGALQAETEARPGHAEIILAPVWRVVEDRESRN